MSRVLKIGKIIIAVLLVFLAIKYFSNLKSVDHNHWIPLLLGLAYLLDIFDRWLKKDRNWFPLVFDGVVSMFSLIIFVLMYIKVN